MFFFLKKNITRKIITAKVVGKNQADMYFEFDFYEKSALKPII